MEKKIRWWDSMRGIACLIVLAAHVISLHSTLGRYTNGCGKIGVWFFMLMASFLLIYHSEGKNFLGKDIGKYYWNKLLRLYPVYMIGLVVAYFSGLLPSVKDVLKHIFLMEGIGHFWYMPVIIKFFIIAPVFKWIYSRIKSNVVFSGIVIIMMIIAAVCFPFTEYVENSTALKWYMPVFLMGMLLCMLYEKMKKCASSRGWDVLAGILMIVIVLLTPWMREKLWGIEPSSYLQNKYLLIGGLWFLIFISISKGICIKKILEKSRVLQKIGELSYSIYIFHYIILFKLKEMGLDWGLNVIVTIILSIVISMVLRYLVEKPVEKFKIA